MAAFMVVYMNITDPSWVEAYFAAVPAIIAEYGGISVAGGRDILRIEGRLEVPERIAVLSFPSMGAIDEFMRDTRYHQFRQAREAGADTSIFIFENLVTDGGLA